ncbi:MAG: alpha/beta hydrolase [bacterium]|nr:alpha/beta hydrolase [bacterium]
MRRAFIIHGWEGNPEEGFFPWLKSQLEAQGFVVDVPAMTPADAPTLAGWVPQLAGVVGVPTPDTYLIGHSVGCITILRYLEGLDAGEQIGGVVLVAGFTDALGYAELASYFTTPINWDRIQARVVSGFVALHSDDDAFVPLTHGAVFKKRLGATIITLHSKRHFEGSSGIRELPEALDAVLGLAGM